jgi:nucleoside-diphosphate-sugar epimerase
MPIRYLITGATGFVGGHIAEAAVARGTACRALVRPTSDAKFLESLGVRVERGELSDIELLHKLAEETDVVVHCAAKVGDSGSVEEYRPVNVEALRNLLEACKGRPLQRFIHMSTLGVYEARHHYGTDETDPLPASHIDAYTQTKVEADQLALAYYREHGVPVVLLRPGFVYGPRDRAVMPRLFARLKGGRVHYLGAGNYILNCIYIDNLVEAVFLAADNPRAVGNAYNLTDGEPVTKRRFLQGITDAMAYERPHQLLPPRLARLVARMLWRQIRRASAAGRKPWLTPAQFKFLLLNLDFSIEKARRELGYRPVVSFEEGFRRTIAWYQKNAQCAGTEG